MTVMQERLEAARAASSEAHAALERARAAAWAAFPPDAREVALELASAHGHAWGTRLVSMRYDDKTAEQADELLDGSLSALHEYVREVESHPNLPTGIYSPAIASEFPPRHDHVTLTGRTRWSVQYEGCQWSATVQVLRPGGDHAYASWVLPAWVPESVDDEYVHPRLLSASAAGEFGMRHAAAWDTAVGAVSKALGLEPPEFPGRVADAEPE